ncbi:hypothetical protein [Chitinophaga polysaccharea]|uniref:hypothetical protein n=1 Tax=Chitinophaga polysaccharea TaxID=1293035 RepID=UPI00115A8AAA|nr:hypothetical protein [Chitinophaga polysaccharea]
MNLEEAKNRVRQAIKENINYDSEYRIDEDGIIGTDFAWYIPFMDIGINKQDIFVGAYYGFIVGKILGDLHRPGSGFTIEKWLISYELGLLDGPHDLIITKIKNGPATKLYLRKLNLTYFRVEIENGIHWKIPKHFTDKMINERLANLPCKFKNQSFSFHFEAFKEIKESKIFDYELIKTVDAKANEIGERIE